MKVAPRTLASITAVALACSLLAQQLEANEFERFGKAVGRAGQDAIDLTKGGKKGSKVWNRTIGKDGLGGQIGEAWDKTLGNEGFGRYAKENPLEAALLVATMAYGGYLLATGSPLTLSVVVPTVEGGSVALPIATYTVSGGVAGTTGLTAGGLGLINQVSKSQKDAKATQADLDRANKFREDLAKSKAKSPEEVEQTYSRYFNATQFGRTPQTRVYLLDFAPGNSGAEKMQRVEIAAPVQAAPGGDVLTTGDFMNLRPAGTVPGTNDVQKRVHAAYDIRATVGSTVYAPMTGTVTAINKPYGEQSFPQTGQMLGVTITAPNGMSAQIFYVAPNSELVQQFQAGKSVQVYAGSTVIGTAQDVHGFYVAQGSADPPQNHVHLQFLDQNGDSLSLDGKQKVTKK